MILNNFYQTLNSPEFRQHPIFIGFLIAALCSLVFYIFRGNPSVLIVFLLIWVFMNDYHHHILEMLSPSSIQINPDLQDLYYQEKNQQDSSDKIIYQAAIFNNQSRSPETATQPIDPETPFPANAVNFL